MLIIKNERMHHYLSFLCIMYPLVHVFLAYILNGEWLLSFYFIFSLIVFCSFMLIHYIRFRACFVKGKNLILLCSLLIEGVITCAMYKITAFKFYFPFAFCVIYFILYSNNAFFYAFKKYVNLHQKLIICIQVVYYLFLMLSVLSGTGIDSGGWGTTTLKGPYSINHVLAYELLVFTVINQLLWIAQRSSVIFVLSCINIILIILTGVRGVLLSLFVVLFFSFLTQKVQKKFLISIVIMFLFVYLYNYTGLFQGLIEKTNHAILNGSATNGRAKIFYNSLCALISQNSILNLFFGIGYDNLLNYNDIYIYMPIHAHNDFIDALVQYGIIGLTVYMIAILSMFKVLKTKFSMMVYILIFLPLAAFNGFYMYETVVVMNISLMVYANAVVNKITGKKGRNKV